MRPGPPKRWIVLGADGRHVTAGRAGPPSEAEILGFARALVEQQAPGAWLVEMTGEYWGRGRVTLRPLRELVPGAEWRHAEGAFHAMRCDAIADSGLGATRAARRGRELMAAVGNGGRVRLLGEDALDPGPSQQVMEELAAEGTAWAWIVAVDSVTGDMRPGRRLLGEVSWPAVAGEARASLAQHIGAAPRSNATAA